MENRFTEIKSATLINSFPGIVYECLNKKDWPMTFVSNGAFELTGYHPNQLTGPDAIRFSDLIIPEHRKRVWDTVQNALKTRSVFQIEYKIKTAGGEEKWVFEQGQGVYDSSENVLSLEGFINDITQRKLSEEQLRESLYKYKTVTDSSGVGIWHLSTTWKTLYLNKAMCNIIGISSIEDIGEKTIDDFFTKESRQIIRKEHKKREKNLQSTYEVQLIRKDKSLRTVVIHGAPLMNHEGKLDSVIGTIIDVTELKHANEALKKSEERFRILFENSPLAQGITRNGALIQANQVFTDLIGYSNPSELVGHNILDYIDPRKVNEIENDIKARARGDAAPSSYEIMISNKNREERLIRAEVGSLELSDGQATILHIRDITEEKLAESKLMASEAKFRSLFESELMGIVISNEQGVILEANNAFLKMLGYDEKDIETKVLNWKKMTPPEYIELDEAGVKEIFQTGIMRPFEKEFYKKDGKRIPILVGASLLGNEGIGVSFVVDISELRKSQIELESTNKELNTFLYMASHDLKGPLASVIGLANIAKEETNDSAILKYLDLILQSTTKLDKSLMNLMKIMKIKGATTEKEPIDFKEIISEVKENLKQLDGFKKVNFSSNINLNTPFFGDLVVINSVMQNLIENAIKYQSSSNPEPFVNVNISEMGSNIIIEIEDNGRGIDPAIKHRVFDMFYRGTSDAKGSGLGLYIVKNAIEKINGLIDFKAREKGGTIFTVVLPNLNSAK